MSLIEGGREFPETRPVQSLGDEHKHSTISNSSSIGVELNKHFSDFKCSDDIGPTARKISDCIAAAGEAGINKFEISKNTGIPLELVERILTTLRARGLVCYSLLWTYWIEPDHKKTGGE